MKCANGKTIGQQEGILYLWQDSRWMQQLKIELDRKEQPAWEAH
jgi:hypothetical protein